MKVAAVIAEYNPFHKGHQWQLEQIRKNGNTHIAVIMSPDFTQRGTPAIFPKRVRATAALQHGADLIIELPVCYASASAQRFAFGAVQLAAAMGCVDTLVFGAENADLFLLEQACMALEDERVEERLREQLTKGITFAKAREIAVQQVYGDKTAAVLQKPNNILAVEYIAQLNKITASNKPQPMALERIGNEHDGAPVQNFASASYIRSLLYQGDWEQAQPYLPQQAYKNYREAKQRGEFADFLFGERAVLSALRKMDISQMQLLPDISEGIENRLYQAVRKSCSIQQLYQEIKTKRYPLSRVRRLVMSAFLQLPANLQQQSPPYLRILGMNERGREILSKMKVTAKLPVSTSLARLAEYSDQAKIFAHTEADCADQYRLFTESVFPCGQDLRESASFLFEKR